MGTVTVPIPSVPGISIKKVGRVRYVYYAAQRTYDPVHRYTLPRYVCIGKLSGDSQAFMVPNGNFATYFPDLLSPVQALQGQVDAQLKQLRSVENTLEQIRKDSERSRAALEQMQAALEHSLPAMAQIQEALNQSLEGMALIRTAMDQSRDALDHTCRAREAAQADCDRLLKGFEDIRSQLDTMREEQDGTRSAAGKGS